MAEPVLHILPAAGSCSPAPPAPPAPTLPSHASGGHPDRTLPPGFVRQEGDKRFIISKNDMMTLGSHAGGGGKAPEELK